jgi:hypothetical protein
MPYVITKKNGKRVNMPFLVLEHEAENLQRDTENCYTLVNTTTRRTRRVGRCARVSRGRN